MNYDYHKSLFNEGQRDQIDSVILNNGSKEILDIMTSLNDEGVPIFNADQLYEIKYGVIHGFPKELMKKYCKITNDKKAIYNEDQMAAIISIFNHDNISNEIVDTIIKTKNDIPIFDADEMSYIFSFVSYADDKQKQQFIECVESEMSFDDFSSFLHHSVPAECMRIYKSLHFLGCEKDIIWKLSNDDTDYKNLKEIKYLFQSIFNKESVDIEEWRQNLTTRICARFSPIREHSESYDIIFKCLDLEMDPMQIYFIMDPLNEFSVEDKKTVAIGFLNSATIEDIEKCMSDTNFSLKDSIDNLIKEKFFSIHNLDEEIEIKTDYFGEIESR